MPPPHGSAVAPGRAGHEALCLRSPRPIIRPTPALQAALGIHSSLQHGLEGELQPTQALTLKPEHDSRRYH